MEGAALELELELSVSFRPASGPETTGRCWPMSADRGTRVYGRERLGAVFRESLPNDGGRSKLTFAVRLRDRLVYLGT